MDAILLAAGVGLRTRLNYPKQLMRLGGKPIIIHSLEVLKSTGKIDRIYVTVIQNTVCYFSRLIQKYGFEDVVCIPGGDTRQESVYNGLKHCTSERVVIHEAARPFITKEHLLDLISVDSDAVVPCIPATSTVLYKDGFFLNRDKVLMVQLPQIYNTQILKKAHELGAGKSYTDDSSLVYKELGIFPTIVDGLEENIKVTTPMDVKLAEVIYDEISSSCRW